VATDSRNLLYIVTPLTLRENQLMQPIDIIDQPRNF